MLFVMTRVSFIETIIIHRQAAIILWNNSLFVEALQASRLVQMQAAAKRLRTAASGLEKRIRFNQTTVADAIETLISQAELAQAFLRRQGPQELNKVCIFLFNGNALDLTSAFDIIYLFIYFQQLAIEFGKEMERLIDDYVNRVTDHFLNKIGKCGPLSNAYNATTGLVCQQIFYPFVSILLPLSRMSICQKFMAAGHDRPPDSLDYSAAFLFLYLIFILLLCLH